MFMEIQGLKKSFGSGSNKVTVLKGIDFSLERGEFCVLLGPSGSGKSTLLNIVGGIDTPDQGAVIVNGEKMADMTEKTLTKYLRNHLGYVFQMYNLIPNLNVQENIEVGAYLSDDPLDVNELMHTLGLYEHRHKMPNQLSGGHGNTVIMVTHNDAIKNMADRVIRLRDGMIRKNYINENKIPASDLEW